MGLPFMPSPGFAITPTTQNANTVITGLVPPFPGPQGSAPILYALINGYPNWWSYQATTHITTLLYTTAATVHNLYLLRPLNWTTFSAAVAKNATSISLTDDPGVYSTNWRYPIQGQTVSNFGVANPQTGPAQVADAAISSTNKYVAYQLADGTWQLDTISSGTFGGANLVLTTGTPNRTNGTIAAGAPLFYFGAVTLANPATGQPHLTWPTAASTNLAQQLGDYNGAGIESLWPGDPLMFYSSNGTNQGWCTMLAGDYRKF